MAEITLATLRAATDHLPKDWVLIIRWFNPSTELYENQPITLLGITNDNEILFLFDPAEA
jgi:hypothetical protein